MPRRACIPRHQTSSRGGRVNCWIITEQRWRRLRLELDCVCLGIGHLVPLSNLTASFTCDASARKSTPSNQLQFAGSNSDLRLNSLWCVWWTFFFLLRVYIFACLCYIKSSSHVEYWFPCRAGRPALNCFFFWHFSSGRGRSTVGSYVLSDMCIFGTL